MILAYALLETKVSLPVSRVTHLTLGRGPLPLAAAAGLVLSHSQRSKSGWMERIVAIKPGE